MTWSEPTCDPREGNPEGYWKYSNGKSGDAQITQRYSPSGSPISEAEAHPGRPGSSLPSSIGPTSGGPASTQFLDSQALPIAPSIFFIWIGTTEGLGVGEDAAMELIHLKSRPIVNTIVISCPCSCLWRTTTTYPILQESPFEKDGVTYDSRIVSVRKRRAIYSENCPPEPPEVVDHRSEYFLNLNPAP